MVMTKIFIIVPGILDSEEDFVDVIENEILETQSHNTSQGNVKFPDKYQDLWLFQGQDVGATMSQTRVTIIAESLRVISAAMDSDAELNTLKHVKQQNILDRLEAMGLSESDMLRLLSMFEADQGLGRIFMGITKEAFAKSWAINKLYGNQAHVFYSIFACFL